MKRSLLFLMIGSFRGSSHFLGGCCTAAPDEVERNNMEYNSEQAE